MSLWFSMSILTASELLRRKFSHERFSTDRGDTMNVTCKSIDFDKLTGADTISMQTMKNSYQFSVLDPGNRKGLLSGGSLGDHAIEAFLSGTVSDNHQDFDTAELKTGGRAVFFIESKKSV